MRSTRARKAVRGLLGTAGAAALLWLAVAPAGALRADNWLPASPPSSPTTPAAPGDTLPPPTPVAPLDPPAPTPPATTDSTPLQPVVPPDLRRPNPAPETAPAPTPAAPVSPPPAPEVSAPQAPTPAEPDTPVNPTPPPAPPAPTVLRPLSPLETAPPAVPGSWRAPTPAVRETTPPTVPARPVAAQRPQQVQPMAPPNIPPAGNPPGVGALVGGDVRSPSEEQGFYAVQLEPPGPERLFRLESECSLEERIRQEGRSRTPIDRIVFPDEPKLGDRPYAGRTWPPLKEVAEPFYVCYGRLYFEQKNEERFGWDLGAIEPFVSAGKFFADVATFPYHRGTDPCRHYDCNTGYCLPGDPVPYLIYPPELSITGALAEAATIATLVVVFP